MKKPRQNRQGKRRKTRKNPDGLPTPFIDMVPDFAGTLAVSAALQGASLMERLLVAAIIPTLLKIVRGLPKPRVDKLLEKLYPPVKGVPKA